MLPDERVKDTDGYMQEAFLVETRSMGGYSGSPVFVYGPVFTQNPKDFIWGARLTNPVGWVRLLGIDCGHLPHYDKIVDENGKENPMKWRAISNTGMAIVIPAWRLNELLNTEELRMKRREKDRELEGETAQE